MKTSNILILAALLLIVVFLLIGISITIFIIVSNQYKCKTTKDCTGDQICSNGKCASPPSPPTTPCFLLRSFDPTTDQIPTWAYVPPNCTTDCQTPGLGTVKGTTLIGSMQGLTTAEDYGEVSGCCGDNGPATDIMLLQRSKDCPAMQTTINPQEAVTYQSTPLCIDTSGVSGALTPWDYTTNACRNWNGMGTFELIKNDATPPRWACIADRCMNVPGGKYESHDDCVSKCKPHWACIMGKCVAMPGGKYESPDECKRKCKIFA